MWVGSPGSQVFRFPPPSHPREKFPRTPYAPDDPTPTDTDHGVTDRGLAGVPVATRRQGKSFAEWPRLPRGVVIGPREWARYSHAVIATQWDTGGPGAAVKDADGRAASMADWAGGPLRKS